MALARPRHRRIASLLPVAFLLTVVPAVTTQGGLAAAGRDFWPVPSPALTQQLGVIPASPDSASGYNKDAVYAAGRGIPLGGIGAGSFMYNQAGTFGPFELRTGLHEERILPQGALHLREQVGTQAPVTKVLATSHPLGSVLPAWSTLSPGDGTYSSLYPFGWTSYTPFQDDVSVRFWSPIVAGNDQWSSQPVAYFDVRLANHTSSASKLSVMFTFPNAPLSVSDPRPNTRTGLYATESKSHGVTAVSLGASNPANVPDAQNTEWTIAAKPTAAQSVSYLTSWNGNGDGSDVENQFSSTGSLGNTALDSSSSAGAIAVAEQLSPGQVQVVHLALAWDFPEVMFGDPTGSNTGQHTTWMRRYTSYYGAQETNANDYVAGTYPGRQGAAIAAYALSNETTAQKSVTGWWNKIVHQSAYPSWLRQAALNELYYDVFGASFWESGLVENTFPAASIPQFGTPNSNRVGSQIAGTHLFGNAEGRYPYTESYDVRAYQSRQLLTLFPDIERDVQRAWTEFILQDTNGHAPHDAGYDAQGTGGSPYIVWPGYPSKQENWLDVPAKYLVQAWEYYKTTSDSSFLQFAYPAMVDSYNFILNHIPAGEHLPVDNGTDNTYDTWGLHGTTSYVGGLWILAQEVMQAANNQAVSLAVPGSNPNLSTAIAAELPNSKSEYQTRLWDPTHKWYRISTGDAEFGTGVMADATFAEWVAQRDGLADIVDTADLQQHLASSYRMLVTPFHDNSGNLVGSINGINADGTQIQSGGRQPTEVWTGVAYFYAATLYGVGNRFSNAALKRDGLNVAKGVAYQTWGVPQHGYAFATPEAWLASDVTAHRALQYARPRSIWELVLAIRNPFP